MKRTKVTFIWARGKCVFLGTGFEPACTGVRTSNLLPGCPAVGIGIEAWSEKSVQVGDFAIIKLSIK